MNSRGGTVPPIEWGIAWQNMRGEAKTGDRGIVIDRPDGILIGVVDGLGHGDSAATAAEIAIGVLERMPEKSVTDLMTICDDALHGTRGAVMSIAAINVPQAKMTWIGVGNVEAVVVHAAEWKATHLIPRPGIVGYRMPKMLRPADVNLEPGVTAIFATDGVDESFSHQLRPLGPPKCVAERILRLHGKEMDDALVLVARYSESKA